MTNSIPILWRLNAQRYQLSGSSCAACGHKMFPPREVCPVCAEGLSWAIFDGKTGAVIDLQQLAPERSEAVAPLGNR